MPAGRRSGKTELAKRKLISRALAGSPFGGPRLFAGAPTRDQAKRIYWDDLCALCPPEEIANIRKTDLTIELASGGEIAVVGMDKPQRIEGSPWDGGILDEFANMRAEAWSANVRPALADRHGWCDLIGVPEGRNHYFDLYQRAAQSMREFGAASEWGAFTWFSSAVLSAEEIAGARADLDERTFRQEYEASFESYAGVVLFAFDRIHSVVVCPQRPNLPIHVGLDFNVNPMTASVWQEWPDAQGTTCSWQVDEVVIPTSNTDEMATELTNRYGNPQAITIHPDPSGASHHTSSLGRTDISILRDAGFNVQALTSAPLVRDRLNLTNARFKAADGKRRAFVHPKCKRSIQAYERLVYKTDTSEPDKTGGFDHYVDNAGYYFFGRFGGKPVRGAPLSHMGR